ncbi:MAG: hypothetical protein ACTSX8_05105 [Alphaproteobacteria bacterium]
MSSPKIDKAWEALGEHLDKLDPEHGRVGRRNSRKAVMSDLRKLRTLLDQEFPSIAATSKPRRKPRTVLQRRTDFEAKMRKLNYCTPETNRLAKGRIAEKAGVKVHRVYDGGRLWIPLWLELVFGDDQRTTIARVKRISKSRNEQKSIETIWRLSAGVDARSANF